MDKVTEIRDSYYVTYGVFYSMGVLTFVPHHFFMVATDYWMYKFRDPMRIEPDDPPPTPPPTPPPPSPPPTPWIPRDQFANPFFPEGEISDDPGPANERTPLQASFISSFSITCQISMLAFLVVTALFSKKLPAPPKRIKWALFSMLVLFLINTAFTNINTDAFQEKFFAIIMVLAVLLNLCSAVIMMSLFELVTKFPLDYYATILSGQAIAGAVTAIVHIAITSIRVHFIVRYFILFMVGSTIVAATALFYLVTNKKSKYFIYRIGQYEGTCPQPVETKPSFNVNMLKSALQRTKWYLAALVFTQGTTSMVHPGMTALIVSVDRDSGYGGDWNETYFVPVITFLGFSLFDIVGREAARKIKRPKNDFVILGLASVRIVLVPLLMLCNVQPRKHTPVFFEDHFYIVLISMFGLSQGYLVNLCIISVARVARQEELEFVAILLPLFSVLSATICAAFNLVIISLI